MKSALMQETEATYYTSNMLLKLCMGCNVVLAAVVSFLLIMQEKSHISPENPFAYSKVRVVSYFPSPCFEYDCSTSCKKSVFWVFCFFK